MKGKVREAVKQLNKDNASLKIACLGLAFKPNIDDLRESPSVYITRDLANEFPGAVLAVEPNISELPAALKNTGVQLVDTATAMKADVILLLVDHDEFKKMTPEISASQALIDTRGIWVR